MAFSHEKSVRAVREYFDEFATGEWDRLDSDALGKMTFEVHLAFMTRFIELGMRILEELACDQELWNRYVLREIWAASKPGALDSGTHILFAASP